MSEKNLFLNSDVNEENTHPKTRVFLVDTNKIELEEALLKFSRFISPTRMKKIARLAHLEDKKRSLGAELALCLALKSFSLPFSPPKYFYSLLGKPLLSEDKLNINISHSGSVAVCAASEIPVGVDILESDAYTTGRAYRRIVSSADSTPENNRELLALWTKKESYVKLIGSGLRTPMTSFAVIGDMVASKIGCPPAHITFSEIKEYFLSLASYEKITPEYFFFGADDIDSLLEESGYQK
ncbi:MAG: 4'-phosphopantetheinyl transferase superfamily protein [Clostridia bacterium]|nr:4'-phosphopantetheinyl transferase superfamily protein [Clostridia bacterium]